jgi:hypothetical protein
MTDNISAWMINDDARRALRDARHLADLREGRRGERLAHHPIPGRPSSLAERLAAARERLTGHPEPVADCCAAA